MHHCVAYNVLQNYRCTTANTYKITNANNRHKNNTTHTKCQLSTAANIHTDKQYKLTSLTLRQ